MSLHRQCYARHHGLQLVNRDGVSVLQITNNCSPFQSQSRPPKCFITYHQKSHLLPELLTFPEHLSSSAFHWGVCCPTVCFRGTSFWLLLVKLQFLLGSFYSRSVFSLWLLVRPFYSRSVGLHIMASGYPICILKLFEKTYIHVVKYGALWGRSYIWFPQNQSLTASYVWGCNPLQRNAIIFL